MPTESSSSPTGTDRDADMDTTGMLPQVSVRLADFIAGEPSLPFGFLLVVSGEARGTLLSVERLPSVIGRSDDADLVIHDETVSRRHATIDGDRSGMFLNDLGSSNGTTLNGNATAGDLLLRDGDLVGFGSATVLVKRIA